MLIEVMGPDGQSKAKALKEKLSEVLRNEADVTRPVVRGEIRLVGLDDSSSVNDVKDTVVKHGGCLEEDIRVGTIRPMANGLHTVWVQCPLSAATKLANQGKVRIGWTSARVDLLNSRPTQCHRCWRFGHLKHACKAKEDFSKLCFRCGGGEHTARFCTAPPLCKICAIDGKPSDHRIGSNVCPAVRDSSKTKPLSTTTQMNVSVAGSARRNEPMELGDGH
ncbi:gag-pol polyprotein [Lasius niger]|uniref:Gag-pol polyprotein n=1 Tax=Lasius niger TaxID=67767 RepID=A0A0J7JV98_LASNI|nr:gag-pol polyprotein [Lasius niger]